MTVKLNCMSYEYYIMCSLLGTPLNKYLQQLGSQLKVGPGGLSGMLLLSLVLQKLYLKCFQQDSCLLEAVYLMF